MHPLYFGSTDKQLYGVYHQPSGTRKTAHGVVFCCPFGQEYMMAHRAYRQLALLLARSGFHVLRFDYYGTGDSAGDAENASIGQWTADIGAAIDELRDTVPIEHVSLVGLRLGGALAATVVADRGDVERLVLWDPVVDGADYLRELISETMEDKTSHLGDTIGINGFPLTKRLREELPAIALLEQSGHCPRRTYLVTSKEREQYAELREGWASRPGFEHALVPYPGDWNFVDDFGGVLIPQAIIQAVVAWFSVEGGR